MYRTSLFRWTVRLSASERCQWRPRWHGPQAGAPLVRAASASVRPGTHSADLQGRQIQKRTFSSPPTPGAPAARRHRSGRSRKLKFTCEGIVGRLAGPGFQAEDRGAVTAAAAEVDRDRRAKRRPGHDVNMAGPGLGRWIYGSVAERCQLTAASFPAGPRGQVAIPRQPNRESSACWYPWTVPPLLR